jgi:hypothetical protein
MSNIDNFFGGSNLTLGPADLIWDAPVFTGDTGLDLYLGGTQGLSIQKAIQKADLTKDQYGTSPANKVATGQDLMVTATLVELQLDRLEAVFPGFQHYTNTAGATIGFGWESVLGQKDSDIERVLKINLLNPNGTRSTDPDKIIYIANAAPNVDTEIAFDPETQRAISIEFTGYRRPRFVSSVTGAELYYFSQSMVDNGIVVPGTT